jgi:protein involved in polysaccharide export with SLBB domain
MRKKFSRRGWLAARCGAALLPCLVLFCMLAFLGFSAPSQAQQFPNSDALNQLQQQFQNRGTVTDLSDQNPPQNILIQPAVPPRQAVEQPPSRLEQILSARAGAKLQQFGYDQLGRGRAVVVPQTGAVQDDYVLGPGDQVLVSLRGQENGEFRATIDRNGQVVLPRLPPIAASGRTFGSFRQDLEAAVSRAYVATNASVSVGRVRQISVLVSGEVNNPGQRLLTGLSSAVDALLLSGGVRKTGSLRHIRLIRGGHEYPIDLYSVLTGSGTGNGLALADGDRIVVPSLGRTVAITGLVRQPGIYELPAGRSAMSVQELMRLAGGREVQGRYRLSVLRITADGSSQLTQLPDEKGEIHDSEILFVQLGADQTTSQATLSGGTGLAGAYPITAGTRLSDLLKAPGALGPSPYTPFGIIVRKDTRTLMRQLMAFTPVAVLNGREDQTLQGDDMVRVLSVNEAQLLTFVVHSYLTKLAEDQNRIRNPLSEATEENSNSGNTPIRQLANQGGTQAELEDISSVPANIQRQDIIALLDTPAPGSEMARRRLARSRRLAEEAARGPQQQTLPSAGSVAGVGSGQRQGSQAGSPFGPQGFQGNPNQPSPDYSRGGGNFGDEIWGPDDSQNGGLGLADRPLIPGQGPRNPADLDMTQNYTEQAVAPGGYASNREVQTFGQLARQLGIDPLVLVNFLVDRRARLDGAVRGPGYYFIGPGATLDDLVQAAGGTVNWADESGIELISTAIDRSTGRSRTGRRTLPLRQGMLASYVVQPHDQFRFSQVFADVGIGSVTVQGEVRYPGTFPILRGEHLSDLLARAGGLTNTAYPYGTVFLRQSAAQAERQGYVRAASEVQNQLVVAMTRVGNDKIAPDTFASMQSFVTELRNQKALGRISITADPSVLAANPSLDPLLEAGDVIYIPQRPSTVAVLGQVLQQGSFPYRAGNSLRDYIEQAGGYSSTADESQTFIVLPNGVARRVESSWLSFDAAALPPGSSIVVPRDVTPLDLRQTIIDVSQIFSQFAVSIASVAVLSRQ